MAIPSLYLSERLADVLLAVPDSNGEGNVLIPVHTLVLCAASEPFYAMFHGNFERRAVVEIPDALSDDFKVFLRYFYTGTVELTDENVFPVLYLAEKYLVKPLVISCKDHIEKVSLDSANVLRLLTQAHHCGNIPKRLWNAVEDFAADALQTTDFLYLGRSLLRQVLQRDMLRATETVVYERLKQWAEHQLDQDGTARRPVSDVQIREFLGVDRWLVRFTGMTAKEFADGPARGDFLTAEEKVDVFRHISSDQDRAEIQNRLPLLNARPRGPPSRDIPGVTIETLVAGDGRHFPQPGQHVSVINSARNSPHSVRLTFVLDGRSHFKGVELALLAMSVGERARITISRDLIRYGDQPLQIPFSWQSHSVVITLLAIEEA